MTVTLEQQVNAILDAQHITKAGVRELRGVLAFIERCTAISPATETDVQKEERRAAATFAKRVRNEIHALKVDEAYRRGWNDRKTGVGMLPRPATNQPEYTGLFLEAYKIGYRKKRKQ